jgi:hypothetical protein
MSDATPDNNATEGVDYKFWSQMSGWTVAEAAALLLDIDPDRLPEDSDDRRTPGWEYRRLFRLLDRAREMEELECPMTPREFLAWASSNGIKPPGQLEATVRAGKPHRNWRTRYRAIRKERDQLRDEVEGLREEIADNPKPRARTTLLKLVGGMARAKFNHSSNRHGTAAKIGTALDHPNVNWHLANNSIKAYLDEADALYDADHPKNSSEI